MDHNNLSLKIFGRTFDIKCSPSQVDKLKAAAALVDTQMRQQQPQVSDPARIAMMAALNLAHTVVSLREAKAGQMQAINEKLSQLTQEIDNVLG